MLCGEVGQTSLKLNSVASLIVLTPALCEGWHGLLCGA